jgi:cytochrome P450
MLFGGGGRLCPGKELGIAEIATFLHHFITQYRFASFVSVNFYFYVIIIIP